MDIRRPEATAPWEETNGKSPDSHDCDRRRAGCPRHGGPGILPGGLILKDKGLAQSLRDEKEERIWIFLILKNFAPWRLCAKHSNPCGSVFIRGSLFLIRVRRENANIEPKRGMCGHGRGGASFASTLIECPIDYKRAM